MTPVSILFVCLGNICRSPMAETVFRAIVLEKNQQNCFKIDSAGIINAHEGELADRRMRFFAEKRGYSITHKSRPILPEDFEAFDLIICMDHQNWNALMKMAKSDEHKSKIHFMTEYSSLHHGNDVPDPYYGGDEGFNCVIDMLEEACAGLYFEL
jgi:protein-tyrosine phosphatase